jgi:hypothetical protein
VKADVDDLKERKGGGEAQVSLHLANQVAAGQSVFRR